MSHINYQHNNWDLAKMEFINQSLLLKNDGYTVSEYTKRDAANYQVVTKSFQKDDFPTIYLELLVNHKRKDYQVYTMP